MRFEMFDGFVGGFDAAGDHVLEQQRRVRLHRLVDVDDVRQHLVIDLDQRERLVGDGLAGGRDGGDRMALVEHLLARHDVARHVPEIHRDALGADILELLVGQVLAGHHRLDAGQRRRLRRVDRADARMGVRRAQDARRSACPASRGPRRTARARSPSARHRDGSAGFQPTCTGLRCLARCRRSCCLAWCEMRCPRVARAARNCKPVGRISGGHLLASRTGSLDCILDRPARRPGSSVRVRVTYRETPCPCSVIQPPRPSRTRFASSPAPPAARRSCPAGPICWSSCVPAA